LQAHEPDAQTVVEQAGQTNGSLATRFERDPPVRL